MKKSDKNDIISIKTLKGEEELKSLNYKQVDSLCSSIRDEIIDACSKYGGHLSSNLGIVETTVALHRVFSFPKDKLIFDVGHQCYTHKLLSGRSLENLNMPGFSSGFQKINESVFDPYEAGHSSTSISAAEGFAIARDYKKEKYEIVALIGDGSIVNGLSFEGLNDLTARGYKVIIILNDNDMAISQPAGSVSKLFRRVSSGKAYNSLKAKYRRFLCSTRAGQRLYNFSTSIKNSIKRALVPITLFDNLGYTYIGPINGHDVKAIEKGLKRALVCTKSVIVHVRTIKGKGYKFAENDKSGYWHGVTPFDIETGRPKNTHPDLISFSHYFADLTDEIMNEDENTFLIVPATLKGSGLEKPFAHYKDRCLDVGIAEEHALTLSGSLSLNGFHPIITIYSTFLQRAYDELSHDCARMNLDMTILIDRAGLVGKNGDTHQGLYDESYLSSIPNVILTQPSTKQIAKALYKTSLEKHGVFCIRYPREFVSINEESDIELPLFGYQILKKSKSKNMVIGVGGKGRELLSLIKKDKIDTNFIDPIYLNPISAELIKELLKQDKILVYDPYGTDNGFAANLALALLKENYKGQFKVKSVPNQFVNSDSYENQLSRFSLLPRQVEEYLLKEFK